MATRRPREPNVNEKARDDEVTGRVTLVEVCPDVPEVPTMGLVEM